MRLYIMKTIQYTATAFLLLFSVSSFAKGGVSAVSVVRGLESEARAALNAGDVRRANAVFAEYFDMRRFSERCLADHWNEFSPSEQARFIDLFERNIKKRIAEKMILTKEDTDFGITPARIGKEDGGLTRVDNKIRTRRGQFGLGVILVNDKGYRVVDYDFDGALLSRNYRGHFNYVIRKYGKDGFFDRLEKKLET